MAVVSVKHYQPGLRWGIFAGVTLITLLVCYGLLRYPATLTIMDEGLILAAMGIMLALYPGITFYCTQAARREGLQTIQPGIGFGLLIGGFWMIEVVSGNLGDPGNPFVQNIYRGSSLLVIISALFAGIISGRQSGRIRQACLTGLWSGMISGLLIACTNLLMGYLFMTTLMHNSQNIQDFLRNPQNAPDITTFLTGNIIVASMSHLFIAPIMSVMMSTFGGLLGKGLHVAERKQHP